MSPASGGAIVAAALIAILNALLPPLIAALRLPFALISGFVLVLVLDAVMLELTSRIAPVGDSGRLVRMGTGHRPARLGCDHRPRRRPRHERRRHLHLPGRPAHRTPFGRADSDRRARNHLSRDRRPRPPGAAAGDARRQRPGARELGPERHAPPRRVGDRFLVPDRGEPGRDPARLERRHLGVPLGREGDCAADDLLGPGRLRRDRASPFERPWPVDRRRREPRQPAVGRGRPHDPHGQQAGGREGGESRATARFSPTASTSRG